MKTYKEKIEAQKEQYFRELKYHKENIQHINEPFLKIKDIVVITP